MGLLIRLMKNEQALRKQESNFPIEQQSGLIQAYLYLIFELITLIRKRVIYGLL